MDFDFIDTAPGSLQRRSSGQQQQQQQQQRQQQQGAPAARWVGASRRWRTAQERLRVQAAALNTF